MKYFWPKKIIYAQKKNFGRKNIFWPKNHFWRKNILSPKKIFQISFGQKSFDRKKFWSIKVLTKKHFR